MSGAFGWGGKDRAADRQTSGGTAGFGSAYGAYQQPAPATRAGAASPAVQRLDDSLPLPGSPVATLADLTPKDLVADADNVLIVSMDMTGSMGEWRDEIYRRMPLLFKEAQALLGQSLAVLFIAFGDVKFGDRIWVTKFGAGPELDGFLDSLPRNANGGGDEEESPELVALYVLQRVDVSRARNVYFWTITDESPAATIESTYARQHAGVRVGPELSTTKSVFDALARKLRPFVVLKRTDSFGYDPDRIRANWERTVGPERVLPLDDGRRVVDVMLAVVAKTTGQTAAFTAALQARQGGTKFGAVNIDVVQRSVALVPDGAAPLQLPAARSKCLLPDGAAPMTAASPKTRK